VSVMVPSCGGMSVYLENPSEGAIGMLDLRFIRENPGVVKRALEKRGENISIDDLLAKDERRRELIQEVEALRAERNKTSEEIGRLKKAGEDAQDLIRRMRSVSAEIKQIDEELNDVQRGINDVLLRIPNIPHESVPVGKDESENVEVYRWGEPRCFDFEPRPHWDLGVGLDILDFERAGKVTGARFTFLKGAGARLERALINFMLDLHTGEHGYREVFPPFIAGEESMTGTGQLPRFAEDMFRVEGQDYYLIPTAEVPVTNLHRDEILDVDDLPLCYVAYSACFRAEAGAYGRDTRGLIRQHQFNKVELVKFVKPEDSYDELGKLLADAEDVLKRLELPYRRMKMCTGDVGFAAAVKYDPEVWMPSYNDYVEISSCSNFEDFQARRANIRFKRDPNAATEYVHTLNGSGLAVGRTAAAIIENYQCEDGSIEIPAVLRPYMGGLERIEK